MPLRVLDLRGTPPPFDAALPRPDAPGRRRARRRWRASCPRCAPRATRRSSGYTAELDKVDVSDGLRVPPDEIEEACADVDPGLREALEVAFGRIVAYHAHEGTPPGDLVDGGITVGHLTRPVERAGIYAPGGRARYPSTVLMCAAPARVAGVGEPRAVRARRPPTAGSTTPRCAPPPSPAWTRSTGSAGRRRSPPWPTGRPACPPSTSSRARATPTWPRPSARCRASSAWRRPSPAPPRSSSSPGPDAPPPFAAIDLVVQAEHGPDGLAWLVPGTPTLAEEIVGRGRPHRGGVEPAGRPRGDAGRRRASPAWSTARAGARGRQHDRARAPAADGARGGGPGPARPRAERRRGLHRRLVAGQHGGLHRRAQPRAADQPDGALRLGPAGRRLPQAPARRPA